MCGTITLLLNGHYLSMNLMNYKMIAKLRNMVEGV